MNCYCWRPGLRYPAGPPISENAENILGIFYCYKRMGISYLYVYNIMSMNLKSILKENIYWKYNPPHVDITKSTRGGTNPETKKAARQLFYDFYAMDTLHRQFGPSGMNIGRKIGAAQGDPRFGSGVMMGANFADVEYPLSGKILNKKQVDIIEDMYEQVTKEISSKLLLYLRLALMQELRYLMSSSVGWVGFRQALVSHYNKNKKISREDFEMLVKKHIPKMSNDIDSVMRLLKFSKYYSEMHTVDDEDPYDIARKTVQVIGKPLYKKPGEEPTVSPEPEKGYSEEEPPSMPGEPSDTDYGAPSIEDPFGGEEEPTSSPATPDPSYSEEDWYWNPGLKKRYADPSSKKKKVDEDYASGRISPSTVRKVNKAAHKAGLTWEDVEKAYNNIQWGGAMGGKKWGTGTSAFLKLMPKHKNLDIDEMAGIVDHIFDLQHNTGGLLNKGGMNMDDDDLDRRAKATHVARYLPYVSPTVRKLILMFLKYMPGDPEIQKNADTIINSPSQPLPPEQAKVLTDIGFYPDGNAYKADIIFFSKSKNEAVPRDYEVKLHTNGKYSIADDLRADVQIFDKFEDVQNYVGSPQFKKDIKQHGGTYQSSGGVSPPTSEKQKYINTHTRIALSSGRAKALLDDCKMGWRPSSKYYKAYFESGMRFYLYVFNDGSYLCTQQSNDFKIFTDWNTALSYCKEQTKDASPYPDIAGALAHIGVTSTPIAGSTPAVVPPIHMPAPSPATQTPNLYTAQQLPANSPSKASYTAHSGIDTPPKHTIRLTAWDELTLINIGFDPKMFSGDVWYIHKGIGDTVKFYPNNTAKLLITGTTTSPVVTLTIDKALAMLPTKYSVSMKTSPANVSPAAPAVFPGKKAGSMFEKHITDAGFVWDEATKQYFDGNNLLIIDPYPASTIHIFSDNVNDMPEILKFNTLPSLIKYLNTEYPKKKVSPAITPTTEPTTSTDSGKSIISHDTYNLIADILTSHGFEYKGSGTPNKEEDFIYDHHDGSKVNISVEGKIKLFSPDKSKTELGQWYTTPEGIEAFKKFINSTFNLVGSGPQSQEHNGITSEEDKKIQEIVDKHGGKYWSEYIHATPDQSAYVEIFYKPEGQAKGEIAYSVGATGDYYQINDKNNKPMETYFTFDILLTAIGFTLKHFPPNATSVKSENLQIFNEIIDIFNKADLFMGYLSILPSKKIQAIKTLRKYIFAYLEKKHPGQKIRGSDVDLTNSKYAIEHFPDFLEYVKQNGIPPMSFKDHLMSTLGTFQGKGSEYSTSKGTTGDTELDTMLNKAGFTYKGTSPGDVLGMEFITSDGAKIKIYDDKSSSHSWESDFIKPKNVNFDGYAALKQFLNVSYISEKTDGFPSVKELEAPWQKLWMKILDYGFVLMGPAPQNAGKIKGKVYKHKNGVGIVVWANGTSKYILNIGQIFDFNTFPELESYLDKIYNTTNDYAKHYYDDLGSHQQSYSIRLTEEDDKQMWSMGWVYKAGGVSGYVHQNTGKKVVFFNKSIMPEKPTATKYDKDGNGLLGFKDEKIYEVIDFLKKHPETDVGKPLSVPAGGKEGIVYDLKNAYPLSYKLTSDAANAGFHIEGNAKGIRYDHANDDFWFQVFENGIFWSSKGIGTKEWKFPKNKHDDFLTKVLGQISPEMNDKEIETIFSKGMASREENKRFDKLLRIAKKHNGSNMEGTNFDEKLQTQGFGWDEVNKCYINPDLHQAVAVTLSKTILGHNEYHFYWIRLNGKITSIHSLDDVKIFSALGPDGAIAKSHKKVKNKDETTPSWETYKTHSNEANASLIKLNKHDEGILAQCGFKWVPQENAYYRNALGDIFSFYDTGNAIFTKEAGTQNYDPVEFGYIPSALEYAVEKYIDPGWYEKWTADSTPMPWSNFDYEKWAADSGYNPKDSIQLVNVDDKTMGDLGFEVGTSNSNVSDGTINVYKNKEGEQIIFHVDGTSAYFGIGVGTKDFDSIKSAMEWLWNKKKSGPEKKSGSQELQTDLTTQRLKKLGFELTGKSSNDVWFYKKYDKDDVNGDRFHQVEIDPSDKMKYTIFMLDEMKYWAPVTSKNFDSIEKGLKLLEEWMGGIEKKEEITSDEVPFSGMDYVRVSKVWGKNPLQLIKLNEKDTNTLESLGFLPGMNKDYIKGDNQGERIAFYANGNATYWANAYTSINSGYKPFSSIKEAMQFLWDKYHKTSSGEMPFSGLDYHNIWKKQNQPQNSTIQLTDEDGATLKKVGWELHFIQGTATQQFAYATIPMKGGKVGPERMFFYADGTAEYYPSPLGLTHKFPSVELGMKFLWDKDQSKFDKYKKLKENYYRSLMNVMYS